MGIITYSHLVISNELRKSKHNGDIYSYAIEKGILEPKKHFILEIIGTQII